MDAERTILTHLDDRYEHFADLARAIRERPETALHERYASRRIADELEAHGFSVARGAGGMETAFVARKGSGSPVIGILGEYTRSLVSRRTPAPCAALALDAARVETELAGTVRYYGCPAEETLTGKTFKVHFRGVAAYAAGDPHDGRSALDGAMLMDVASSRSPATIAAATWP